MGRYLKILGQFLSTLISWIHCKEDSKFNVHFHSVTISEDERFSFLLLARQDYSNLELNETIFRIAFQKIGIQVSKG